MWQLAQYSNNYFSGTSASANTDISTAFIVFCIIAGVIAIVTIVAMWKIFAKAGQKGWKAIIPIYNIVILSRIAGFSGWYAVLLFIPYLGWLAYIPIAYRLAKAFGYGAGMTILQLIVIGNLILGFGQAKYSPPKPGPANI